MNEYEHKIIHRNNSENQTKKNAQLDMFLLKLQKKTQKTHSKHAHTNRLKTCDIVACGLRTFTRMFSQYGENKTRQGRKKMKI